MEGTAAALDRPHIIEQAGIVPFWRHTLLPSDDGLHRRSPTILHPNC